MELIILDLHNNVKICRFSLTEMQNLTKQVVNDEGLKLWHICVFIYLNVSNYLPVSSLTMNDNQVDSI